MKTNETKVRGCCMGIPFGCGTLMALALVIGGAAGHFPLSGTFLLSALGAVAAALVIFVGAVIASEWLRESRSVRGQAAARQRSPFAPSSR